MNSSIAYRGGKRQKQHNDNYASPATFRLSLRAEYSTQIMYDAIMIAGTHIPATVDPPRRSRWCSPSNITAKAVPPATYLPVRRWSSWQQKYRICAYLMNILPWAGISVHFARVPQCEFHRSLFLFTMTRLSLLEMTVDMQTLSFSRFVKCNVNSMYEIVDTIIKIIFLDQTLFLKWNVILFFPFIFI